MIVNIIFMLIIGMFVNGLYVFIMIVVLVDLGMYSFLSGNFSVLVMVMVIMDGMGFIGVVMGLLLMGYILVKSWIVVFLMLMVLVLMVGLFLMSFVVVEVIVKF